MQQRVERETIATLRQAIDRGYQFKEPLATDERFAHLQGNRRFDELLRRLTP
jgi:hypothetical protein